MLPFPMVHSGYPSFGPCSGAASARHSLFSLCRGGSSDPLFSPLPAASQNALIPIPTPDVQSSTLDSPSPTTFVDAVDAASSISPLFATLTKNTRGGGTPSLGPTQPLPLFSTPSKHPTQSKPCNPSSFMALTSQPAHTPGRGQPSPAFALCGSAHSASLRYPFPPLASPLCLNAGGPNEP